VSNNTYTYGIHTNLTPPQLFFLVMLDEAAQHFGVDELTGLALLIIGWPFLPTRRKPKGATIGTSIASRVARRHLDFKIEKDILPTLTLGSVRRLKILWTRNIGVFVGRTVPIIGEVILAYDLSVISYRSAVHYNQLVKPEDRL
jgi:hypothetical protein